jgi:lipopolysaccharide transport system ATP-binding protein
MSIVIKVENLSKKYIIGHQRREPYLALRDVMAENVRRLGSRLSRALTGKAPHDSPYREEIWALKDVSCEIKQGERVGIIGRNGAGKSTLLKVLSRITVPTSGRVSIRGNAASLLEIGTGFHPELTGRENIYLNGAILGMKRADIQRKFDEIVAFAETEKFLDTPIKRYSSGMHLRLAFAVAAHLEPEILIVDEVLAVGDAQFQKKCLGKMEEIGKTGRTVLFVSHNMQAIRNICSRAILLNKGEVICDAATEAAIGRYTRTLEGITIDAETGINNELVRRGSGAVRFTSVEILDANGNKQFSFEMGDTIRFKMSYKIFREMQGLTAHIALRSGITREIVTSAQHLIASDKLAAGTTGTLVVEFPDVYIRPGEYPLYFHICDADMTPGSVDVLDDLTAPLVITVGDKLRHSNFDPSRTIGYFSLPSRTVLNEINNVSSVSV